MLCSHNGHPFALLYTHSTEQVNLVTHFLLLTNWVTRFILYLSGVSDSRHQTQRSPTMIAISALLVLIFSHALYVVLTD